MNTFDKFVEVLKVCEAASGSGSDDVKKQAIAMLDETGKRAMVEMFSIFRVFGLKKCPEPAVYASVDADADVFFELLDRLARRDLTGNAARDTACVILGNYTEDTAKYLKRILDKDPKAGFSESTVNKVFPGLVPVFKAMKGEKVEDKKKKNKDGSVTTTPFDFEKNIGLPARIEIKHDGLRSIVFSGGKNQPVMYFSYEGRIQEQWQGLFDDEVNALAEAHGCPIVLDSEVEGENFLETIKAKKEGNDLGKSNLRLKAFDIIDRADWDAMSCTQTQQERSDLLAELLEKTKPTKIVQTVYKICHSVAELKAFHADAVEQGYEGTMVKKVHGLYEWKRSSNWWKWKPVMTVDLTVVGFYEGKKGTKNEGSLGGLILEGTDENGKKVKTDCGGFKLRDGLLIDWMKSIGIDTKNTKDLISLVRAEIWNNQEKYLGLVAEIEGQELSLAEDSDDVYSVRFPQFKRWRFDKSGK